ncbi:MAG: suppressor of fused domain protein, partial [Dehalococcoidia bacterium]|nr:suppressor of fused domain protein [Dehalococcoidia bacterium]
GLKDGRVEESKASPEDQRAGNQMIARVAVVSHYGEFFGEGTHEFGPWRAADNAPDFYIMLHPPTAQRPYFTYGTFGLSIAPQPAGGPSPRLELVAYSEKEDERVAQYLLTAARMVATASASDPAFKANDTVDIGDDHFILVVPDEAPSFARFPNEARKPGDVRFTFSVGARDEADAQVAFLQLMPVSAKESQFATEKGTPALLGKLGKRPKYSGWEKLSAPQPQDAKPKPSWKFWQKKPEARPVKD